MKMVKLYLVDSLCNMQFFDKIKELYAITVRCDHPTEDAGKAKCIYKIKTLPISSCLVLLFRESESLFRVLNFFLYCPPVFSLSFVYTVACL